jgi:cation:H+ antiporter
MLSLFYILVFLVAVVAIGVSSGLVARSFVKLSRMVGMNEYVVSFALMGVVTSIPEIFIAIASVIQKVPLISVGNIIGANFANVTLALGLVAILSDGIDLTRQVSKRVFWLSLLLTLVPTFLIFGGGISRVEGLILCLLFIGYLTIFSYDSEFLEKSVPHIPYGVHYFRDAYPCFVNLAAGLLILILSSVFMVIFASGIASSMSLNLVIFGAVFLGFFTTLPELFFGIKGALLRHPLLSVGNLLASAVFNGTAIVGVVSVFSPTTIQQATDRSLMVNTGFMVVAFVLLSIFSYTGSKITRLEGILLVSLYGLFLISNLIFFI